MTIVVVIWVRSSPPPPRLGEKTSVRDFKMGCAWGIWKGLKGGAAGGDKGLVCRGSPWVVIAAMEWDPDLKVPALLHY